MKKYPDSTVYFIPSKRLLKNPHKGFTTFQRFNGDKLNENWTIDKGWMMEELPDRSKINDFIMGDGYPDCTLCYFRVPWNIVEKEEGIYDFSFIDFILDEADKRGQKVILRIVPNSNRPGPLELPQWLLKKLDINKEREIGNKETPLKKEYFDAFGNMILNLGKHIDGDFRLDSVDMSLVSAWGENDQIDMVRKEDWQFLVDSYMKGFEKTPLVCQFNNSEVINYALKCKPVGMRGDCLGNLRNDIPDPHTYTQYVRAFSEFNNLWEKAPVNFEVCWIINHWISKGWDIDFIIDQSLKWHMSSFNAKSARISDLIKDKLEDWIKKMGYRYCLRIADYVSEVKSGDIFLTTLFIENRGVAPIYHKYPLILRLRNEEETYEFEADADITEWLPGCHKVQLEFALPEDAVKGIYSLEVGITDKKTTVLFANDQETEDGFTVINEIEVL